MIFVKIKGGVAMCHSNLDERLCFNLYNIQRQVNRFYSNHVLHDTDLTYTQYLVLTLLWKHEKLNLKTIAELLQLDNATISPLIKRIENLGYIKREKDIDRKSTRLNSSHVAISYAVFCLKKKT